MHWAFNDLGLLLADQGKLEEAEKMYLLALAGKEKALRPDHISVLDTINNLGLLYKSQGKYKEAEDMFLRALAGYKKAQLPDHPSTLDTTNNLGLLDTDQGKLEKAEEAYLYALARYKTATPAESFDTHLLVINTMKDLGDLSKRQGRLEDAKGYYESACGGLQQILGPSHRKVQFLYRMVVELKETSSGTSSPTDTAVPTQASESRRRDTLKKVLGIHSQK